MENVLKMLPVIARLSSHQIQINMRNINAMHVVSMKQNSYRFTMIFVHTKSK